MSKLTALRPILDAMNYPIDELVADLATEQQPVENYLTVKQACNRLNICRRTLYNMMEDGTITPIRLRRKLLFPETKLMQVLS